MMGALPQSAAPPGLAPFLAATGQPVAAIGEEGGFGQLLAAAPQPGAITAAALPQSIEIAPLPATATAETASPARPETAKGVAVPVDSAAVAASLLIAVAGASAAATGTRTATALPAGDAPETDGDTGGDPVAVAVTLADPATAADPAIAGWTPVAAAMPATAKSAKPVETTATASGDMANTLPAAAKPAAAPTAPALTAIPAEPQGAKALPADGAASMTILFTQPAGQSAAAAAEAVQPAIVTERVLDMGSDDAWIDQLARDIAATKSTTGDISFRLMPRHLGRLDIAMRQGDEGVSLTLDTRHEATAIIVTAAQGRLVDDLRQQGVRVAGTEVTYTPGETGRQSQQGQDRGTASNPAHLIETASEGAEPRPKTDSEDRAADRRGRFA